MKTPDKHLAPLLLLSLQAPAQEQQDSLKHLPRVEVIASPKTNPLSPSQTIHLERNAHRNNLSVADAIRYFSGVQVKDYGGVGGLKTVNVRNMGTHHVGVFYDGIQLGNAQNGQTDLGKFSLENLEEIQLNNGQRTEFLQTAKEYGSASTIYLKSREPKIPTGAGDQFNAGFRTGSFGLFNPSFRWSHRISDSISSDLSTEITHAHGRYAFRYKMMQPDGKPAYDTTAIRQNGDITGIRVEGGLYGHIPKGEWRLKLYDYHSERGLPGFIASNLFRHGQRQWDQNSFLQGSFQKKITENYKLRFQFKYAYDYTRYLDDDTASMYTNNRYRQQEIYLSFSQEWRTGSYWKTGLSADYQFNTLRANLVNFSFPTRHSFLVAMVSGWQWQKFSLQGNLLSSNIRNRVKRNTAAPSSNIITPSLHASFKPFKNEYFHIRAFYKKIFRMPTFNDLYYTFIGNAVLEPEYTTQYNLGMSFQKKYPENIINHLEIRADAYYNEVTNKIVAVPTANPFRWMMLNLGFVRIQGLELATASGCTLASQTTLAVKLNYTFQKARDLTDENDSFFGHQIPYAPLHSFSSTLQVNHGKWNGQYSFLYTGERYAQKANIKKNYLPAWYTSDITFSRSFQIKTYTFIASLELNNLLNQHYDVVLNYPMPGRNIRVSTRFNF